MRVYDARLWRQAEYWLREARPFCFGRRDSDLYLLRVHRLESFSRSHASSTRHLAPCFKLFDADQRAGEIPLESMTCVQRSALTRMRMYMHNKVMQATIRIGDAASPSRLSTLFGIVLTFGVAAIALIATFHAADWYAENVSLYRYCNESEAILTLVDRILTGSAPAGTRSTQPYVVAAKLIYLVPQQQDEPLPAYLARLQRRIEARCQ